MRRDTDYFTGTSHQRMDENRQSGFGGRTGKFIQRQGMFLLIRLAIRAIVDEGTVSTRLLGGVER